MRTFFERTRRCVAMLLAVVMVLSLCNVGGILQVGAADPADDAVATTLGELIASNYGELTNEEKTIIRSGVLSADKGYSYILPPAEVADGGLISVDEDSKTVTVSVYQDKKGNVWIPVSFDLKNSSGVIAGHDDLSLTKQGDVYTGTYTTGENQFSVEVSYELNIHVPVAEQQAMLEAGEKLAQDIAVLKLLDTVSIFPADDGNAATYDKIQKMIDDTLGYKATLTPELVLMFMVANALDGQSAVDIIYRLSQESDDNIITLPGSDYEYELFMSRPQAVAAAKSLYEQKQVNNQLALGKFLTDHAADSYLEWIMVHGDALADALISNYEDIDYLANNRSGLVSVSDELGYLLEDMENYSIFDYINELAQEYGYTIKNEQQLKDAIDTAKATREQKLNELEGVLAQLGYNEPIDKAADIDGAVAFVEAYDPYAALTAEVQKMGLDYTVTNDDDIETLRRSVTLLYGMGQIDKATLDKVTDALAKVADFNANKASYIQQLRDGKTALESGDQVIANLEELQTKLPELEQQMADMKAQAEEEKAMLDMLILIMQLFCQAIEPVYNNCDNDLWNAPSELNTQKAINYDNLTELAEDLVRTAVTVEEPLYVTTAVVKYNMSMYNISVVVKASVVDPSKYDSAELIDLRDYEAPVITLRKDAGKQEIMDAIAQIDPDAAALAQPGWQGVITTENYVRTADQLADSFALAEDLVYVITYQPKTLSVTYGEGFEPGHGLPAQVPYGYKLTLPTHGQTDLEYIYTVNNTDNLDQGTNVVITENTAISRKEGAMSEKQYLTTLVVKSNPEMDAVLKNILLSDVIAKGNGISIVVPGNDNLEITFDEQTRQVVIKALPVNSRVGTLKWTAASGYLDTPANSIVLTDGVHSTTTSFQKAYVEYKLPLTTAELGVTDAELLAVMNIPYVLATDYKNQKSALDGLLAQLSYLKKLNNYDTLSTPLGDNTVPELLNTVATLADAPDSGFMPGTAAAARELAKLIRDNGVLPLCATLDNYQAAGMYDFYTNDQSYLTQINELYRLLNIVVVDSKLMGMLPAEYESGFVAAQAALEEAYKLNNDYKIDRDILVIKNETLPALRRLLNDLAVANATEYKNAPQTMTWVQTVSGNSPGNSTITIQVTFDGYTVSDDSWSVATGTDLDRTILEQKIAALTQQAGMQAALKDHYIRTMTGDSDLVSKPQTIKVVWTAKEYKVFVDGSVELGTVTVDGGKIKLPAHPTSGYVYEYTIGGDVTRNSEYTFSTEKVLSLLNGQGNIQISRVAINVAEAELVNKATSMGTALVKDATGAYTMVLPLNAADPTNSLMPFSMGLFMGGNQTIKLGNDYLLSGGKYYLQSLVDALLSSGISSDSVQTLIDANGNAVSDLSIAAGQILNRELAAGETENTLIPLGGTLLKTTLTFDENAPINFYITLTGSGDMLKQVRELIVQAQNAGFEILLDDEKVQVSGELNDELFALYAGLLTMMGEADIDDINALSAEVAVGYLVTLLGDAMTDEVTVDTIQNTAGKLGAKFDLSKYESVFNMVKDILQNKAVRYDANDDSICYVDLKGLAIKGLIDNMQSMVDGMEMPEGMTAPKLSSMIAEYDNGLDATIQVDVRNLDKDYVAVAVNADAAKAGDVASVVTMMTAEELAQVSNNNIIVLLSDIGSVEEPVELKLNKSAVLDLNGKRVYGSITAGDSKTYLVDSDYSADAYVSGSVTGKDLTVLGGKYQANVSAFLKSGYAQDAAGLVRNKYFTIATEGNDIVVNLNLMAERELATREHLVNLALEIVAELAMTHYNTAAMTIDGKTVFDLNMENVLGLVTGTNRLEKVLDTALGCISAPQLAELVDVLVADFTDFAALETALLGDGVLAIYDFNTSAWNLELNHDAKADVLDVSLRSGKTLKQGKLKLVLSGEMNDRLAELAGALAATTTITSDFSNVQEIYRDGKKIVVSGSYNGTVVMDFTKDYRYPVMMAVVLADGNAALRAKLVDAIEAFYATNCTNQAKLEKCFDALTVQQVIQALQNSDRNKTFAAKANAIGLSQSTLDQVLQIDNTAMGFDLAIDVMGVVLNRYSPSLDGTLGALKKTDANGIHYYGATRSNVYSKDINLPAGYQLDCTADVENLHVALYLFSDHVHVPADAVEENLVKPSCEEGGSRDMVVYCSVCGEKLSSTHELLPATDHSFTNYVSDGNAKCDEDGTKTAVCDNGCGETDTVTDVGSMKGHGTTTLIGYRPADYEEPGYTGDEICDVCGKVVIPGHEINGLLYEIVVTDKNGNPLYKGADVSKAMASVADGCIVTVNGQVTMTENVFLNKAITINGIEKIVSNGNKIFLTDAAAQIAADAAVGYIFAGINDYMVVNNANVYTLKQVADPTADNTVAGIKVDTNIATGEKYLFLDLDPVNGKTLNELQNSLTFADLAACKVTLDIDGNNGTALVKTADTMFVTATDSEGNVVASIVYTVIVMGDVNCDGKALSNDATAIMQIYFGNVSATKPMLLAADINCDGTIAEPVIGAADAQRIMHKYFDWGKTEGGYTTALQ